MQPQLGALWRPGGPEYAACPIPPVGVDCVLGDLDDRRARGVPAATGAFAPEGSRSGELEDETIVA